MRLVRRPPKWDEVGAVLSLALTMLLFFVSGPIAGSVLAVVTVALILVLWTPLRDWLGIPPRGDTSRAPLDVSEVRELHRLSTDLRAVGTQVAELGWRFTQPQFLGEPQDVDNADYHALLRYNKYHRDRAVELYADARAWGAFSDRSARKVLSDPHDLGGICVAGDMLLGAADYIDRISGGVSQATVSRRP